MSALREKICRFPMGKINSRDKGNRGMREAKALLEKMGHEVIICHKSGVKDLDGGDLWVDRSIFVQVKYGPTDVPKSIYKLVENCKVAFVRRVGGKDRGYSWLKIEKIEG